MPLLSDKYRIFGAIYVAAAFVEFLLCVIWQAAVLPNAALAVHAGLVLFSCLLQVLNVNIHQTILRLRVYIVTNLCLVLSLILTLLIASQSNGIKKSCSQVLFGSRTADDVESNIWMLNILSRSSCSLYYSWIWLGKLTLAISPINLCRIHSSAVRISVYAAELAPDASARRNGRKGAARFAAHAV